MRQGWIALVAAGLALASSPGIAASSPSDVVSAVVAIDIAGKPTLASTYNDAMKAYFSDSLNSDFMRATAFPRKVWDGDPITGQSDAPATALNSVNVTAQTDTTATVEAMISTSVEGPATGQYSTVVRPVTFYLIMQNGSWRIDDIDQHVDGMPSIHTDMRNEIAAGPNAD